MSRIFSIFLLLVFFISNLSNSQVIIKERVGIKPKITNPYSSSLVQKHIFTYTMTWIPSESCRGNIQIVTCNNDTITSGWSTSGTATISFEGNGRHYYLFQEERYFYKDYGGWGWYWDVLPFP